MTNNFKQSNNGYHKPQLTTEQWVEKRKAEKSELYQEINDTALAVASDPVMFKNYLDTQSRNDLYSAANTLTLLKYCPGASKLREFDEWTGEPGVKIKKGEKSIPILDPYEYTKKDGKIGIDYNIKRMFDVSQTTAKQTPAPTANRDPRKLVAVMLDTAPIKTELADDLPFANMGAYYHNDKQTLYIKTNIGDSVALCQCVAQELGHAQLSINSETYSRRDMGFQATCIGYMLCKKYGVDTKNFAIDALPETWREKDAKAVRAELSDIRYGFKEIHSRINAELYRQKQERSKEQER